jgi:hypothetical protein
LPPARRISTPIKRASEAKRRNESIRRKYKVNLNIPAKLLPSEVPHVETMVAVLKLAGYSRNQISAVVGISRDQTSEILNNPKISDEIAYLRSRIPQAALEILEGYMLEAIHVYVDVIRNSDDDKLRVMAASEILDRGGVPKASRQERHTVNEDRTTLVDDGIVAKLREASPEIQEEAAQLIEGLEKLLTVTDPDSDA